LADLDKSILPDADKQSELIKAKNKPWDREADEVSKQNSLDEAAFEFAKARVAQEKKEEHAERILAKERREARQKARDKFFGEKRKYAEQWRQRREAARRQEIKDIDEKIAKKTAETRKELQIDELTEAKDKAAENYEKSGTFLGRITGRKGKAADDLEAAEKTLAERMHRFEYYIRHINKVREEWSIDKEPEGAIDPQWSVEKEIAKQGLSNLEFREKWERERKKEIEADEKKMAESLEGALNRDFTESTRTTPEGSNDQEQRKAVTLKKSEAQELQKKGAIGKEKMGIDGVEADIETDNHAFDGAAGSIEKAESLEHSLAAKTPQQKAKAVEIQKKAGLAKTKRVLAQKQQEKARERNKRSLRSSISLRDKFLAEQAAKSGELGEDYAEKAKGQLELEQRKEIWSKWQEVKGHSNDNEQSIEKKKDIDNGLEL